MEMTSSRPYLLQAIFDWVVDNGCTPYLLVNAEYPGVIVPAQHIKDGQIVLNISPTAVASLHMDKSGVAFNARFSGVAMDIYAPIGSLLGIYARENGQGMLFEPEDDSPTDNDPKGPSDKPPSSPKDSGDNKNQQRPSLRVVK